MEDTQVLKHHYIYMFRWDAKKNNETLDYMIKQFIDLDITNWIGKHETSNAGKPHYQMAVWTERKFLQKEKDKVRKRFSRSKLCHKTKGNPCGFTDGRKIQSLIAYSTKDQGEAIVQLPENAIDKLPKWKNKSAEKIIFQERLREYFQQLKDKEVGTDLSAIIEMIVTFHIDNDRQPPSKGRMLYYLAKWEFITTEEYRKEVYNYKMLYNYSNDNYNIY